MRLVPGVHSRRSTNGLSRRWKQVAASDWLGRPPKRPIGGLEIRSVLSASMAGPVSSRFLATDSYNRSWLEHHLKCHQHCLDFWNIFFPYQALLSAFVESLQTSINLFCKMIWWCPIDSTLFCFSERIFILPTWFYRVFDLSLSIFIKFKALSKFSALFITEPDGSVSGGLFFVTELLPSCYRVFHWPFRLQMIADLKGTSEQNAWQLQTPPSSPRQVTELELAIYFLLLHKLAQLFSSETLLNLFSILSEFDSWLLNSNLLTHWLGKKDPVALYGANTPGLNLSSTRATLLLGLEQMIRVSSTTVFVGCFP